MDCRPKKKRRRIDELSTGHLDGARYLRGALFRGEDKMEGERSQSVPGKKYCFRKEKEVSLPVPSMPREEENVFSPAGTRKDFRTHESKEFGPDTQTLEPQSSRSISGIDFRRPIPEEERRDPSQALIGFLSNPQKVSMGTGEEIHLLSGAQKTEKERKNVSNSNHHVKGQGTVPEKAKNGQCIPYSSPKCIGEKPKDALGKAPQVHPAVRKRGGNVE